MTIETIESAIPAHVVEPPKQKHKSAAKAKAAKKPAVAKKSKPKAERANKKAEVIALMKRAKGATLVEMMTGNGLAALHRLRLRQDSRGKGRRRSNRPGARTSERMDKIALSALRHLESQSTHHDEGSARRGRLRSADGARG